MTLKPVRGVARTPDGIDLHYTLRTAASPEAPRFAFVHSLALNQDVWTPIAERLAGRGHVLTYDCRGHGDSTRAPGPYSVEQFAGDLAALLDAVGWPSAIVGGASMGGSVAQAFAAAFPTRVDALGLVDTTAWYGPDAAKNWDARARQGEEQGLASLVDFQLGRWFADAFVKAQPELMAQLRTVFLANDVACYAASCRMLGAFDLRERTAGIRVPTAVIVGEEDFATPPEMARWIQEAIPGATLDILPATRHLSPLERPETVGDLIGSLASRMTARQADWSATR
jgi:3-oxoadipate enol-lactonase